MKKERTRKMTEQFFETHRELGVIEKGVVAAADLLTECYRNGGMVLICGNGGSSSDAEHIVGELMKGFLLTKALIFRRHRLV
jgi:D-sedoheptulose 7-phosphate isomerase